MPLNIGRLPPPEEVLQGQHVLILGKDAVTFQQSFTLSTSIADSEQNLTCCQWNEQNSDLVSGVDGVIYPGETTDPHWPQTGTFYLGHMAVIRSLREDEQERMVWSRSAPNDISVIGQDFKYYTPSMLHHLRQTITRHLPAATFSHIQTISDVQVSASVSEPHYTLRVRRTNGLLLPGTRDAPYWPSGIGTWGSKDLLVIDRLVVNGRRLPPWVFSQSGPQGIAIIGGDFTPAMVPHVRSVIHRHVGDGVLHVQTISDLHRSSSDQLPHYTVRVRRQDGEVVGRGRKGNTHIHPTDEEEAERERTTRKEKKEKKTTGLKWAKKLRRQQRVATRGYTQQVE